MDLSPKQFSDIITFTRAGTATRVNSAGVIEAVAANLPRFDYDPTTLAYRGMLVEDAKTNWVLQSAAFDNASWTKSGATVTADAATAPDGTTSADKLIVSSTITFGNGSVFQAVTKPASVNTYTWSAFVKAAELNRARLNVFDAANLANAAFVTISLVDGSVVVAAGVSGTFTAASAVVTAYPNGWYRVGLTFTSGTETSIQARIFPYDSVATTGDGTSGILIWGGQFENGVTLTSYIPTTTATVTRNADTPLISSTNFSQVFNQAEGTIFVSARPQTQSTTSGPRLIEINDGTNNNRIIIYFTSARAIVSRIDSASTLRSQLSVANKLNAGVRVKAAFAFKAGDSAFSVDGGILTDTANTIIPNASTQINIGMVAAAANNAFNGWIEQFRYFPNRLPNATIQALTA